MRPEDLQEIQRLQAELTRCHLAKDSDGFAQAEAALIVLQDKCAHSHRSWFRPISVAGSHPGQLMALGCNICGKVLDHRLPGGDPTPN